MKNLYSKNEFLSANNMVMLNEGLLKGLWNSVAKLANRVKGSKEITNIYNNNVKLVDETFSKMANIETVKSIKTEQPVKQNTKQQQNANQQNTNQQQVKDNQNYSFEDNKLNEADTTTAPAATAPAAPAAPAANTDNQEQKNAEEQKNMVNLKPDQIKKIADTTTNRIEEIKKQFENEVNGVISKLSKNTNYSSDKLKQFGLVTKNKFNSYIYDKWYGFYQKVGDQNKITELTGLKKQNEVNLKKSIDDLNTALGEQTKQLEVVPGKKFTYFSKSNNSDIKVEVIGKALGQDENGQPNTEKPEHKNMWKVKTNKGTFWVSPSSFKKEVVETVKKEKPAQPAAQPAAEKPAQPAAQPAAEKPAQPAAQTAAAQTK